MDAFAVGELREGWAGVDDIASFSDTLTRRLILSHWFAPCHWLILSQYSAAVGSMHTVLPLGACRSSYCKVDCI